MNCPPLVRAINCSTSGLTGTWIRSVKPPLTGCSTMPSVVPTETVVTGMPTLCASRAACCGVTRPAVWPPSEKTHDDRRRPLAARLRRHCPRDRDGTSDRVGERRSLRAVRARASTARTPVEIVCRRRRERRVIREGDHGHAVALRQLVHVPDRGGPCGCEPRRLRVVCRHRARHVEHEHDGRVLRCLTVIVRVRAGEADEQQRQPDQEQDHRRVPAPRRRPLDHVAEERRRRPRGGPRVAAVVEPDVDRDRSRDERAGRGAGSAR